jgi:hypothetical protein
MIHFVLAIASVVSAGIGGTNATVHADPNSAPNPYRAVENRAKLTEGRTWGRVIGADIDRDGKSIRVVERYGGTPGRKTKNLKFQI